MDKGDEQLVETLIEAVSKLSDRVVKLEESINKGRGAFMMFLALLSIVGTVLGAVKLFGK